MLRVNVCTGGYDQCSSHVKDIRVPHFRLHWAEHKKFVSSLSRTAASDNSTWSRRLDVFALERLLVIPI